MITEKTYRGQITRTTAEDGVRVLGLKYEGSNDIVVLHELFNMNLLLYGNYVTVAYLLRPEPFRVESIMKRDLSRIAGYSELISADMWLIGGFNFMKLLETHLGYFVHLETSYNHVPGPG